MMTATLSTQTDFSLPFPVNTSLEEAIKDVREMLELPIVFKTEGPTDLFALTSCQLSLAKFAEHNHTCWTNKHGCGESPIGNDSRGKPRQWLLERHRDKIVFVVHDLDEPGQQGALEVPTHGGKTRPGWATALASTAREVRNIVLPGEISETKGADLEDFLAWLIAQIIELGNFSIDDRDLYRAIAYCLLLKYCKSQSIVASNSELEDEPTEESDLDEDRLEVISSTEKAKSTLRIAVDDPFRLARINLINYFSQTGKILKCWKGIWYSWKDGQYIEKDEDDVRDKVNMAIEREFERLAIDETERWEEGDQKKDPPEKKKTSPHLTNATLSAMRSLCQISSSIDMPSWIPSKQRRNLLSVKNGLLDVDQLLREELPSAEAPNVTDLMSQLEKRILLPHTSDWFSQIYLPYEFDSSAECPNALAVINENLDYDVQKISVLQEWFGYLLLSTNQAQKFLCMEGSGGDGKGTIMAMVSALIGQTNLSSLPLESFKEKFALASTLGKMANLVSEVGGFVDSFSTAIIKAFAVGDLMHFENKNKKPFSAYPTAKLMVSFNSRPAFDDPTNAIWRRVILMPFRRKSEGKIDTDLARPDYWKCSGEIPGLICWALAGAKRLHENKYKFTVSDECNTAVEEHRLESNPEIAFASEFLTEDSREWFTETDVIYQAYRKYCENNGHKRIKEKPKFAIMLKKLFPEVTTGDNAKFMNRRGFRGIRFTVEEVYGAEVHSVKLT